MKDLKNHWLFTGEMKDMLGSQYKKRLSFEIWIPYMLLFFNFMLIVVFRNSQVGTLFFIAGLFGILWLIAARLTEISMNMERNR